MDFLGTRGAGGGVGAGAGGNGNGNGNAGEVGFVIFDGGREVGRGTVG